MGAKSTQPKTSNPADQNPKPTSELYKSAKNNLDRNKTKTLILNFGNTKISTISPSLYPNKTTLHTKTYPIAFSKETTLHTKIYPQKNQTIKLLVRYSSNLYIITKLDTADQFSPEIKLFAFCATKSGNEHGQP